MNVNKIKNVSQQTVDKKEKYEYNRSVKLCRSVKLYHLVKFTAENSPFYYNTFRVKLYDNNFFRG